MKGKGVGVCGRVESGEYLFGKSAEERAKEREKKEEFLPLPLLTKA